jgi:hypothetical protein
MPNKVSASGFSALPYKLMDQADAATWAVYAVLHRHGWNSEQGCWTSLETIRSETGISRKVIQRSLTWLKETKWIEAQPRAGFTTVYFVKTDSPTDFSPRSDLTQVENDLGTPGQKRPTPQVENDLTPRSKTTYKQEPINKNPKSKTQKAQVPKKDPNRLKVLPSSSVPPDLADCSELLVEFWSVKKGTRSSQVLKRITNKLRQWTPQQRQEALERAIASGWGDVFQPKKQTAYSPAQEPDMKHPAHRVFTADRGFDDQPTTNPILNGLF